ncbi:MAG: VOC family protein [Actinobacteria bacterium]|nr:VOC family protein [Actinomycetota bacterium]
MIRGGLVTLFVREVGAAVRFYVETLGMKLVEQAGTGWAVIDAGEGFRIALHSHFETRGSVEGRGAHSPSVGLYPKVPIREAIAIFENRGVKFDVKDDGPVTLAHFRDPDGNVLYLCQEH